ncbi:MAG TPA: hypothetical protein VKA95_13410, partial [Nitrososphaeraceae archaeon]|nr:hypothetical protein [Nitrososphaeraceae archaeon]
MILIISTEKDNHAQAVLRCLDRDSIQASILDLSSFPRSMQLSVDYGKGEANINYIKNNDEHHDLSLSACKVVWWHRPQPFELHPE